MSYKDLTYVLTAHLQSSNDTEILPQRIRSARVILGEASDVLEKEEKGSEEKFDVRGSL